LKEGRRFGFEIMCIFHESLLAMMEQDKEDENNRCNQQNIPPNNQNHGISLSIDSNSNKE